MFGDWHATPVDSDRMEMFSGSICQSALGFTDIELTTLLTCDYIDNISRNTSEVVSDIESSLMARDEQLITTFGTKAQVLHRERSHEKIPGGSVGVLGWEALTGGWRDCFLS